MQFTQKNSSMERSSRKIFQFFLVIAFFVNFYIFLFNSFSSDFQINESKSVTKTSDVDGKIDWHDYKFMLLESQRRGPGEQGAPFYLTDTVDIEQNKLEQAEEGFAVVVSDRIPPNRSLPDVRLDVCKTKKYSRNLPKASVIVIFYNEQWSLLLRCLHSIYNRTPRELLHEIILINDNSTRDDLYYPLETYVGETFGKVVRVIRNKERKGLIVTRMEGARHASGEVLVFLDSHMEINVNWLPPLLEPIHESRYTATVPVLDSFSPNTLEYEKLGHGTRGGFAWDLTYKWFPKRGIDNDEAEKPFPLGVMTGGAYAIRKDYFFELGGYDEGLYIWNGENFELSFKLGLCGGRLLSCPCSHVAHTSKLRSKYREENFGFDFSARNLKRVATVWMDEYKDLLIQSNPRRYVIDIGDISKPLATKRKLNCKPFKYFLDEVVPEILERFPPYEWQNFAKGSISSDASPALCISYFQRKFSDTLGLSPCSLNKSNSFSNQSFAFSWTRQIKYLDKCLDAPKVNLLDCHYSFGHQLWKYNVTTKQLQNIPRNDCISANVRARKLKLAQCNSSDINQKFSWSYVNTTALNNWDSVGIKIPDFRK